MYPASETPFLKEKHESQCWTFTHLFLDFNWMLIFIFLQGCFKQIFYDVASALTQKWEKTDRKTGKDNQKFIYELYSGLFCIFQINTEGTMWEQPQFTVKCAASDRLDKLDIPHIFQICHKICILHEYVYLNQWVSVCCE